MTPEETLAEVAKDTVFYEGSGGGMTLSGGEPLYQFEFTRAILEAARCGMPPSFDTRSGERTQDWAVSPPEPKPSALSVRSGGCIEGQPPLHTCIETCGFGPSRHFLDLVPLVDLFLWDIKDTDDTRHEANTGVPLAPILENLRLVDDAGGATILRCLLIAGVNLDEQHLDRLAAICRSLRNCQGIELLAYHPLGDSKYARLGIPRTSDSLREPTPEQMETAKAYLLDRHGIQTP